MFPAAPLAFLAALSILAPLAASDDTAPYAPLSVVALSTSDGTALVTWAPGAEPADSYRVYGVNPGAAPVLLLDTAQEETPGTLAPVPGGFTEYGVSGVRADAESPLVLSLLGVHQEVCVDIRAPPEPYVAVCDPVPPVVKVRRP